MNWERLFTKQILNRGYDYYLDGAVKNMESSKDTIAAKVTGTEEYDVKISIDKGEVEDMYCSCPYASDGKNCKHMAAVLYEWSEEEDDEYDDEERTYVKLTENSYIFEAKTLLSDFYKILKIDPDEFEDVVGDADTLGGLLLELKGEFPVLHEIINYSCYRFEVLEVDSRRILKVKVTRDLSLDVEKKDE